MKDKTKTLIWIFTLVGVFILLSTAFIVIDLTKVIDPKKYFDQEVSVSYISEDVVNTTANLSQLTGQGVEAETYKSIILTCNRDITFSKLRLNLTSKEEQIVDVKILVNDEEISNTTILINSDTTYYKLKQKTSLNAGDELKILLSPTSPIAISHMSIEK